MEELLRLSRENNRMLRAMRRSSFVGAIVKVIVWVVLIIVPLWFYMQYIAPMLESTLQMYEQMQGTSAAAQTQFGQINHYMEQLRSLYGG